MRMKVSSSGDDHQLLATNGKHTHKLKKWHLASMGLHIREWSKDDNEEPASRSASAPELSQPLIDPHGVRYGVKTLDTVRK